MNSFIKWLNETKQKDSPLVGGKGANLGELIRNGLSVPNGFCVTIEAYRQFILEAGLEDEIWNALAETEFQSLASLNETSEKIQQLILSKPIPQLIAKQITSAYVDFKQQSVAVRSSATAEDSPLASFAGQHASFLNVSGVDNLLHHVQLCWASLWSVRAIGYRVQQGMIADRVQMAVVVQEMIEADVAGVMFTVNPSSARSDQIVINASYGLGEAIVGGDVTPDRYIVNKHNLTLVSKEVGSKNIRVQSDDMGGTSIVDTEDEQKGKLSLSDKRATDIAGLGKRIENIFARAQDIEWALSGDQIFIVQARPVTAFLTPKRQGEYQYDKLHSVLYSFILDYFPVALYHFDRSIVLSLVKEGYDLGDMFGLESPNPDDVIKVEKDGSLRIAPIFPGFTWKTPVSVWMGLYRSIKSLQSEPEIWIRSRWPLVRERAMVFAEYDYGRLTDSDLLNMVQECIAIRDVDIFRSRRDYLYGGWISMGLMPLLLRVIAGEKSLELNYALMTGLEHPTAVTNETLRALARIALLSGPLLERILGEPSNQTWEQLQSEFPDEPFVNQFQSFLREYGFRTGMLIPLPSNPTWRENPCVPLSLIAALAQAPASLEDDFKVRQKRQYDQACGRVMGLANRIPFGQRWLNFFIDRSRSMATERDWIIFAYEMINWALPEFMWLTRSTAVWERRTDAFPSPAIASGIGSWSCGCRNNGV